MDNKNIDLKKLWNAKNVEQPAMNEMISKIESYKKKSRIEIIVANILLLFTTSIILLIWFSFKPQFATTKIGIILTIIAMTIFVFSYNQSWRFYNKINLAENNQIYLANLLDIKNKQQHLHKTILNIYFIFLSIGIALYLFEFTSKMDSHWAVLTYSLTGLWFIIVWFFVRPKQIKKQQKKLNDLITKIEDIQKQLC